MNTDTEKVKELVEALRNYSCWAPREMSLRDRAVNTLESLQQQLTLSQQAQEQTEGQIRALEALCDRRPALDERTLYGNVSKAIAVAGNLTEAINRAIVKARPHIGERDDIGEVVSRLIDAKEAAEARAEQAERERDEVASDFKSFQEHHAATERSMKAMQLAKDQAERERDDTQQCYDDAVERLLAYQARAELAERRLSDRLNRP